jgi:hypothetical protein
MTYPTSIDMFLEKEEFITAAEYVRRVENGTINPADVKIVAPCAEHPWGGFKVRLKTPRYKSKKIIRTPDATLF